ncbi:MAG TPA: hypothetical protein VKD72_25545, partial [Gemmataceae bacterium]|nr:hypothetical protein [Gemmataceae bacterium]
VLQTSVMSYGGNGVATVQPSRPPQSAAHAGCPCACNGADESKNSGKDEPDFSKMTPAQKIAFHKARWDRILG